jgi:hypothetical protein
MREEGDYLDRLSKPHLVCQDAVNALLLQVVEPAKPFELVVTKLLVES